ncbi:MAG: TauD/TfdA family dioxygenase [Alphaproteobacteria bacterium]|jgi:hypothetical protein|nr:TauD/TfdA family dioxygenase [Alphaproteobacteria bacterium]
MTGTVKGHNQAGVAAANPFDLGDRDTYLAWRQRKLDGYPASPDDLLVTIDDPGALTAPERQALSARCDKANMAIYQGPSGLGEQGVLALARQLGLRRLDRPLWTKEPGVTAIQVAQKGGRAAYIPYSNRPLSWHTDGYYNDADHQIRGMVLHCERPAMAGGESRLMDPEIAYIRLRDRDPRLIAALMRPDALTIPANQQDEWANRPARTGPVFSLIGGRLHMRYTARRRQVIWLDDPLVGEAVAALNDLLASDEAAIFRLRLRSGQGLIGNNVLHNRAGFDDGDAATGGRLLYRARYCDRVTIGQDGERRTW